MAPHNKKLLELVWLYFTWKLFLDCHPSINVVLKGNHMVMVFVLLVTWVLLSQLVPPLFFQTCQRKLGWQKKYIIKLNRWMLFNYFMGQITTNDDSYLFVCLFVCFPLCGYVIFFDKTCELKLDHTGIRTPVLGGLLFLPWKRSHSWTSFPVEWLLWPVLFDVKSHVEYCVF